jgi:type IV secretory pathway TrbD component
LLLVGVERRAMIPLFGLAALLVLAFDFNPVTPVLSGVVLFLVIPALRRVNKRDPLWVEVLTEHVAVAGFYRAQGAPGERRLTVGTF